MSSSSCCFLTCIQVSQEAGQVAWYSHLFQNFPFCGDRHSQGFSIVNKAEIDVFSFKIPFTHICACSKSLRSCLTEVGCHFLLQYLCVCGGFPGDSVVKNLPAMWETWVWSLGWEDPLEKDMATLSSVLAWRIPWTEKPGGLQSTGSHSWTQLRRLSSTYIHSLSNLI